MAHSQFCEQFLNPLLLRALKGFTHNGWFRGNLDGIYTRDFSKIDNAQLYIKVEEYEKCKIKVFAISYNILRIMSGMAGLAYS